MKFNKKYILYIYVRRKKDEASIMAVLNIYDINAKANSIYKDFIKEPDDNDKSQVLYDEMQIFAETNINILRYMRR